MVFKVTNIDYPYNPVHSKTKINGKNLVRPPDSVCEVHVHLVMNHPYTFLYIFDGIASMTRGL